MDTWKKSDENQGWKIENTEKWYSVFKDVLIFRFYIFSSLLTLNIFGHTDFTSKIFKCVNFDFEKKELFLTNRHLCYFFKSIRQRIERHSNPISVINPLLCDRVHVIFRDD